MRTNFSHRKKDKEVDNNNSGLHQVGNDEGNDIPLEKGGKTFYNCIIFIKLGSVEM